MKIIVVDNASPDGSGKTLADLPNITFIQSEKNQGFAHGNNLAIKHFAGEYIWFLNPDTRVEPDTIAYMVNYMDHNPQVGVATPKLVLPNGVWDKNCHRAFPTIFNSIAHFLGFSHWYYLLHLPENQEAEVDAVGGSSLLVRREVGEKIKWWDEDYFMYGEDIEFTYRVKELGYKVMYVPLVKILHYHGASSGLKKTSSNVTKADTEIRRRSILATTSAMRIFYTKHHASKNLFFVNWGVYVGIWVLEKIRIFKSGCVCKFSNRFWWVLTNSPDNSASNTNSNLLKTVTSCLKTYIRC